LTEHQNDKLKNHDISTVINPIEIALSLSEYSYNNERLIEPNEEIWFNVSFPMIHSLQGTKWDKLLDSYTELVELAKENNFFR